MAVTYTQYCSLTDCQNRFSDDGINLRIDDKPTVVTAILNRGGTKLEGYLRPRYTVAQLQQSAWVLEAATTICCYYFAGRRMNAVPSTLKRDYEELIHPDGKSGELQMIRRNQMNVPDIPMRKADVPVLSAPSVRLDPFPRTVIDTNRSTGTPEGYSQHANRWDLFDYSI